MPVVVVTPPEPVVAFEDVERHLVEVPAEDRVHVEGLTVAATAWIDGPAGWLGRALGPQLLEWQLDRWPCGNWRWPIVPFLELASVTYVDVNGNVQTLAGPDPLDADPLPTIRGKPGDIRIRYWAGYGKRDPNDASKWIAAVPAPIKVSIMMLVAQWYETREAAVVGQAPAAMPFAVDALLQPYRVWRT